MMPLTQAVGSAIPLHFLTKEDLEIFVTHVIKFLQYGVVTKFDEVQPLGREHLRQTDKYIDVF